MVEGLQNEKRHSAWAFDRGRVDERPPDDLEELWAGAHVALRDTQVVWQPKPAS